MAFKFKINAWNMGVVIEFSLQHINVSIFKYKGNNKFRLWYSLSHIEFVLSTTWIIYEKNDFRITVKFI